MISSRMRAMTAAAKRGISTASPVMSVAPHFKSRTVLGRNIKGADNVSLQDLPDHPNIDKSLAFHVPDLVNAATIISNLFSHRLYAVLFLVGPKFDESLQLH
jgi:hypothetical protein